MTPGLGRGWGQKLGQFRSEKSPGGRQAKGWETAETAAAEVVAAWREGSGHGIPPLPPAPPPPPPVVSGLFSPSPLLKPSNTPPKVGG